MRRLVFLLALNAVACRTSSRDRVPPPLPDGESDVLVREATAPDGGPSKEALPAYPTDELTIRARHLLEAIKKDDPTLATDIVFPRDAYIEAKDASDPGKQWDDKVMGAFQKQVHALHKRAQGIEHAQFTGFELGQPIGQVVPKKHDMTMTLWHVRHSRLEFTVEGKPLRFDLGELMSWKGAWYVVDLR
jgi:hypothetical protein